MNSIAIKFESPGYFIMCAQFQVSVDHLFRDSLNSQHCLNLYIEKNNLFAGAHQFRYKPLFIVLMYMLCASVLCVISFSKYLLHRHKLRHFKKLHDQAGIKSPSDGSLYHAKEKTACYEPLLSRIQSESQMEVDSSPKSVLFKVY